MMEWTTEKPSRPGWYWMQQDSEFPECVEVFMDADDFLCIATQETAAHTLAQFCELMDEREHELIWAGPIPEPTERTEV